MRPELLGKVLRKMNREGGFSLSLLLDREGLLLAATTTRGPDSEQQAAAVALIQGAVEKGALAGLGPVEELSLRTTAGERFVCRRISGGSQTLQMGVMVPKGRAYRRITNRAVRELSKMLQSY